MCTEERIDGLIEAGWFVLDSDFDPAAFQYWRQSAFDCLIDMLGPDHYYTQYFASLLRQGEKAETLAAVGILSAAQQQITGNRQEPPKTNGNGAAGPRIEKDRLRESNRHIGN